MCVRYDFSSIIKCREGRFAVSSNSSEIESCWQLLTREREFKKLFNAISPNKFRITTKSFTLLHADQMLLLRLCIFANLDQPWVVFNGDVHRPSALKVKTLAFNCLSSSFSCGPLIHARNRPSLAHFLFFAFVSYSPLFNLTKTERTSLKVFEEQWTWPGRKTHLATFRTNA